MSGQQIGTAVGFVAGFFLPGGPQVWAAVGGMIGGYVDPTKIYGPKLTDGMSVEARDGIPNPWGFGTFSVGCNIINAFDLIPHKNEDDGKGSGVVNITYSYTRSYAVAICRANRNPDGTYEPITGILRATHNGKVVYDTSPDASSDQQAQNERFLRNYQFLLGGEDQEPHPTLESYMGVGNVSAYRGQVIMVATDEDQTESRGSIGTWEFVPVMAGVVSPYHAEQLAAGHQSRFINADDPRAEAEENYTYSTFWTNPAGGGETGGPFDTIEECFDWAEAITGLGRPTVAIGFSSSSNGYAGSYDTGLDGAFEVTSSVAEDQLDVTTNESVTMFYNWHEPTLGYFHVAGNDSCPVTNTSEWAATYYGMIMKEFSGSPGLLPLDSCGGGLTSFGIYPLCVLVQSKRVAPTGDPPPLAKEIPGHPGYWISPNGEVTFVPTYEEVTGTYKVLSSAAVPEFDELRNQYAFYEVGPVLPSTDPNYNSEAYWTAAYDAKVLLGVLPPDWTYGDEYPQIMSTVWQSMEVDSEIIDRNLVPLSTIVAEVFRRSGLTDDEFDVSQLTDLVDGFKVAVETSGEAIIQELMKAFYFDVGEWDDKIRCIKRGGNAVFDLVLADLAEREGEAIEETEAQEPELLFKVHVKAMDPDAGFVETTQTAQRRSTTIDAKGEQTLNLPIVMDKDTQAQIGDKRIKVAWTERHGLKYTLPYTRPDLTVTDVGYLTDSHGHRLRNRLMEMSEDTGRIEVREAIRERQSSYVSNIEGTPHTPPTDTSNGMIGPTFFAALNLDNYRASDTVPGMYVFGTGVMPGWAGYALQVSFDHGATYQTILDYVPGADMGMLTAPIDEDDEPIEVFMMSGQLSAVTDEQIAARFNGFAITTNGISECGQFKTPEQDSSGIYSLFNVLRGQNGTTAAPHLADDYFVMLAGGTFIAIDLQYVGEELIFRPVSLGTPADTSPTYSVIYNPGELVEDGGTPG